MVIDDHAGTRIGFLSSFFPYNSFYIPLFVFISGYFYRKMPIADNIRHKAKRLLLPYLIWAVVGDLIAFVLLKAGIVNWYVSPFSIKKIAYLFLYGPLSSITGPSWFVIMLFWVTIIYNVLHSLLRLDNKKMGYGFTILSIIAGFASLKLCMMGYHQNIWIKLILRTIWFTQFYHLGYMFRTYFEKYIEKAPGFILCSSCIAINVAAMLIFGDINFLSTQEMGYFHSWWLPLVTTVTGILFWYKLLQLPATKIGALPAVDFLAENTFTIICSHLLFLNIPNFYANARCLAGDPTFSDFPAADFYLSAWTRYNADARLVGFFLGIIGSCLVILLLNTFKKNFTH